MYVINENDFALIVKCTEKNGEWDGNVDIKLFYSEDNRHGDEAIDNVLKMMSLLRTCITMMTEDKKFLAKVHDRNKEEHEAEVHKEMDKHDALEHKVKSNPKVVSKKGNVITIDWGQV